MRILDHTSGEWHAREKICGGLEIATDKGVIAILLFPYSGASFEECEANAELMAAAPMLLKACRMAKEKLERLGSSDFKPVDLEAYHAIVAAIDRAELSESEDE